MKVYKICPDLYDRYQDIIVIVDEKHKTIYEAQSSLNGKPIMDVQKEDVKFLSDFEKIYVNKEDEDDVWQRRNDWKLMLNCLVNCYKKGKTIDSGIIAVWDIDFGEQASDFKLSDKELHVTTSIPIEELYGDRICGLYHLGAPLDGYVRMYRVFENNFAEKKYDEVTCYLGTDLIEALKTIAQEKRGFNRYAIVKDVPKSRLDGANRDEIIRIFESVPSVSRLKVYYGMCEANRLINTNFESVLDELMRADGFENYRKFFKRVGYKDLSDKIYDCFMDRFFADFDFASDIRQCWFPYRDAYERFCHRRLNEFEESMLTDKDIFYGLSRYMVRDAVKFLLEEKYEGEKVRIKRDELYPESRYIRI